MSTPTLPVATGYATKGKYYWEKTVALTNCFFETELLTLNLPVSFLSAAITGMHHHT
jgi:hypothetical protein